MTCSVSAVIPTYNGAAFIGEALSSIFAQSRRPQEVIVVDDASCDDSPQIVTRIAREAPVATRLIRLAQNSGGPAHPLNVGVAAATSEIIVTLDQDDVMTPDRIARQAGLLNRFPTCPLVFGLYRLLHRDGTTHDRPRVPMEEILQVAHRPVGDDEYLLDSKDCYHRLITVRNFVQGASNIAFRKDAWGQLGGFRKNYRIVWDYYFACRACTLGEIGFVARVVQHHRVHETNLSGRVVLSEKEQAEFRMANVRSPLFDVDLSDCHASLAESFFGVGYFEALQGNLRGSLRAYRRAVRLGVSKYRGLYGMLTALPHALAHNLRSSISGN